MAGSSRRQSKERLQNSWFERSKIPQSLYKNIIPSAIDWISVFSPNPYVEILTPIVMVLGSLAFVRWLDHENWALKSKIGVLIKETPESNLSPSTTWGHSTKTAICEPGRGLLAETDSAAPWSWIFKPPQLREISFCCLRATQFMVFLWYQPKWTHGLRHLSSIYSYQTKLFISFGSRKHLIFKRYYKRKMFLRSQ